MSVNVMSLIFEFDMPNIKTEDGTTVPDSTAKFVLLALADHAGEDGENAYIGIRRMCKKTSMSTSTVCNAINALRHNGYIQLVGKSNKDTNNYTINLARFQPPKSDDSSHRNLVVSATETEPSFNHQLNHQEPLTIEEKEQANRKVDSILAMRDAPGIKREAKIDAILSYIGGKLKINTETARWKKFAKFAYNKHLEGEQIETFISWVTSQKNFDVQFWPPQKMEEMWPQAFAKKTDEESGTYTASRNLNG